MTPPALNLYLFTWNLARNLVDPRQLAVNFFRAASTPASGSGSTSASSTTTTLPDVIVLSLQEIAPIAYAFLGGHLLDPYLSRIIDILPLAAKHHGASPDSYRHVLTKTLGLTAIMVFATPEAADRISWIQTAGVGVGLWDMGNKGAVGVRLGLRPEPDSDLQEDVELTFVAAHLAPMEPAVARRNEDWETIARNLVFQADADHAAAKAGEPAPLISKDFASSAATALHGIYSPTAHVFFAGDLNYRTSDTPPSPKDHHQFPQPDASPDSPLHYTHLLKSDQLAREKAAGRVLQGFIEEPITFPPTYKYSFRRRPLPPPPSETPSPEPELTTWPWAKHRFPSWCDRILFLSSSSPSNSSSGSTDDLPLHPHAYTALPVLLSSDHAPVALSLSLIPKPLTPPSDSSHPRNQPPFPLSPDWKQRREAARRKEIAVGVLSWLGLTWEGNGVLLAVVVGWVAVWGVLGSR
ncbi:Endonuclease/exonuclease/phosphatase [Phyllosticta citriasiana]|uniref:Endonuclease/exonuclease/phosphatase n=1 Tax=Phyllosticta citriasiana TaxID=595635 RepID=A0ABR1KIR2_9PEZI